ncbi:hypothetical protein CBR_g433 [Chara braunii]|uniref:Peptidase M48 domain-containing protein n=1 Tax=Chara braunii TaxID=69332 RepID=A0A388KB54_CHABU|nr:hypothetical protein CBR_g433 [Chara braunii]|eukprot:GBG67294.1 hypothetical protein CBR_g433 [Chara braunii]
MRFLGAETWAAIGRYRGLLSRGRAHVARSDGAVVVSQTEIGAAWRSRSGSGLSTCAETASRSLREVVFSKIGIAKGEELAKSTVEGVGGAGRNLHLAARGPCHVDDVRNVLWGGGWRSLAPASLGQGKGGGRMKWSSWGAAGGRRGISGQGFPVRPGRYTDRYGYEHFKKRGVDRWRDVNAPENEESLRKIGIVVAVVGAGGGYVYYTHLEEVPYTNRRHFVLVSPQTERMLGENEFKNIKKTFRRDILPDFHPLTIRVKAIATQIIQAAMIGTRAQDWGEVEGKSSRMDVDDIFNYHGRTQSAPNELDSVLDVFRQREDDNGEFGGDGDGSSASRRDRSDRQDPYNKPMKDKFDDEWVDHGRGSHHKGMSSSMKHLEGLKWEVIVVENDALNAFCLPGGKVVVFTGLLKAFQKDEEIATVLGHEVGHVVARHPGEKLTQALWLTILQLILLQIINLPGLVHNTSQLLLALPFSRRMESEADRIGLLLMATAEFDPRIAPSVYERMAKLSNEPDLLQYVSTHPSGRKRAQALANGPTMDESMKIYAERMQGRILEAFL